MTVRSILEVEVKDAAFDRFKRKFDDYKSSVAAMPEAWRGIALAVADLGGAVAQQAQALDRLLERQRDYANVVRSSSGAWSDVAKSARSVFDSVISTTTALLRWSSIGGIFGGLLGIGGGLWGLDRLAAGVGSARRSAMGYGATYGEQQAFGLTFGRYVDASRMAGGISSALTDITQGPTLLGLESLGANAQDIASGDALRIGAAAMPGLKRWADQLAAQAQAMGMAPGQLYASALQMRQLGGIFGPEDLMRAHGMSAAEWAQMGPEYAHRVGLLGMGDTTAQRWQQFQNQLQEAGKQIEKTFVVGLVNLADPLSHLSKSFTDLLSSALGNPRLAGWINELAGGIEHFAEVAGTDDFKQRIDQFVSGIATIGAAVGRIAGLLGWFVPNDKSAANLGITAFGALGGLAGGSMIGMPLAGAAAGAGLALGFEGLAGAGSQDEIPDPNGGGFIKVGPRNNPGNLKDRWGHFESFLTPQAGVKAMWKQLITDIAAHHQNTLRSLVYGNAEHGGWTATDRVSYLQALVQRTGIGADEPLSLGDQGRLARIASAITVQEGTKQQYSPQAVLTVINATGGNVTITSSQLPMPQ